MDIFFKKNLLIILPVLIFSLFASSNIVSAQTTVSGVCAVRNNFVNAPTFNLPDLGVGYAKKTQPGINTIAGLRAACTKEIYQELFQQYCKQNSQPVHTSVITYNEEGKVTSAGGSTAFSGSSIIFYCNALGKDLSTITGACELRSGDVPGFFDPDIGVGYIKKAQPGVNSLAGLRKVCTREVYEKLLIDYCKQNSKPASPGVIVYGEGGGPKIVGGSAFGSEPMNCPATPEPTPLPSDGSLSIAYPIPELGNCANQEGCRAYCGITNNYSQCTEFAHKNNLLVVVPDDKKAVFTAIQKGESPGQCKDEVSCRKYCEDIDHLEECVAFAEKFDLATPDELKEMRQMAAAKQAGVKFPGNCKTKQSCLQYCEAPSHAVECVAFAEAAGFISGDEAAQARKFAPLIARGETPGGCTRKEQCEAYCQDTTHIDECLDFAVKHDVLPPDELEIVKKIQPFVKAGKMPGGCKSKAECDAYCTDGTHFEECVEIGLAIGVIKPEEVDMIRKSGGKGPGNCRSREACEAFCADPQNQKECMDFAVRIGLITQEEAESYQNTGDVSQCFEEADDKITACFVTNLGPDVFEQMKAGKMPHDPAIMEKMRKAQACVQQYSGQATAVLNDFLKAMPAADACITSEFGPDFIGRLKRNAIPCSQMKGLKGKMDACFQKGMAVLFEPCVQKECNKVLSCIQDVNKTLMSIFKQVESSDKPPEGQKQEFPPAIQDKLNSCNISVGPGFDPTACLAKSTCKEFFACLGPTTGTQDGAEPPGGAPPKFTERMKACMPELVADQMRACTSKPTCAEVNACVEAMQSGQKPSKPGEEQQLELPSDIKSRLMTCQQEVVQKESQVKIDACLGKSCSEFQACIDSAFPPSPDGSQQQQQGQGTVDPRIQTKIQACMDEKTNACLAKPCPEFFACLNSLGSGGGGDQQGQQQGQSNPALDAKIQSCIPQGGGGGYPLLPRNPLVALVTAVLNFFSW